MEQNQPLLTRFTTVAGQVGTILNRLDIDLLDRQQLKLVGTIKRLLAEVRLDIRDWEMSDSRAEMQQNARQALERLDQARAAILLASEYNMFSAIDIAETTAQFDMVARELKA
ncbi:MAG TPA: hypothetical protein VK978_02645 [Candidatus Saccharimonadales bacterium]|nr:hypothetical protein [Candidatus Saccharimonadales bacterium]